MNPITRLPNKVKASIRDKAIDRARTRILLAGREASDFNDEELEIIVKEEEDKLYSGYKEKGALALLGLLGLGFWI